jgi:acyl carrier protein|tara:strand:- start:1642 stop:1908 length:267 start_codon:yes stop_codon:yes gene_type:complete
MFNKKNILDNLLIFLKKGNPNLSKLKKIPLDKSLVELGYLDSFGVIELITYYEKKYKIKINDDEITKKKFGSINKMVNLVFIKLKNKQ